MKRPVVSRDPRKPHIVAALKSVSNCRKVTSVVEIAPGVFTGNCMNPGYDTFEVTLTDKLGLLSGRKVTP